MAHDSRGEGGALLALAPDIALLLYAFLPVADLVSLSAASRTARQHVSEQQHWRDLTRRLTPATPAAGSSRREELGGGAGGGISSSSEDKWDAKQDFVRKAEAELQWRRGRPVAVRERRLALGETGMSQQRLQSMALWRPRNLLLAAVGEELGVFDMDDDGDDDGAGASAAAEAALRVPTARFLAHEGSKITVVRAAPFGPMTAGMDGRVKVLDWEGFGVKEELNHHASAVWGLDAELAGSGAPTVAASCFRRITVSDLRQPPHHHPAISFQGHATWVRALSMDTDRHLLVSGSADASCKTWDLRVPGQMQNKYVHPNHFEEVRSVLCRGDRVYTACYDGVVREFDLITGRLRRAVADHGSYAVEAAQLGPEPTGRLVSVDWSGVVACVPSTEPWHARRESGAEDVETLVYGRSDGLMGLWEKEDEAAGLAGSTPNSRCIGVDTRRHGTYRLVPSRDVKSGRLHYRRLGPREDPPEMADAHMTSSIGCLVHDEDRLLLGTADGRVVSLLFRGGL